MTPEPDYDRDYPHIAGHGESPYPRKQVTVRPRPKKSNGWKRFFSCLVAVLLAILFCCGLGISCLRTMGDPDPSLNQR